jgi:hypothetical protein
MVDHHCDSFCQFYLSPGLCRIIPPNNCLDDCGMCGEMTEDGHHCTRFNKHPKVHVTIIGTDLVYLKPKKQQSLNHWIAK